MTNRQIVESIISHLEESLEVEKERIMRELSHSRSRKPKNHESQNSKKSENYHFYQSLDNSVSSYSDQSRHHFIERDCCPYHKRKSKKFKPHTRRRRKKKATKAHFKKRRNESPPHLASDNFILEDMVNEAVTNALHKTKMEEEAEEGRKREAKERLEATLERMNVEGELVVENSLLKSERKMRKTMRENEAKLREKLNKNMENELEREEERLKERLENRRMMVEVERRGRETERAILKTRRFELLLERMREIHLDHLREEFIESKVNEYVQERRNEIDKKLDAQMATFAQNLVQTSTFHPDSILSPHNSYHHHHHRPIYSLDQVDEMMRESVSTFLDNLPSSSSTPGFREYCHSRVNEVIEGFRRNEEEKNDHVQPSPGFVSSPIFHSPPPSSSSSHHYQIANFHHNRRGRELIQKYQDNLKNK